MKITARSVRNFMGILPSDGTDLRADKLQTYLTVTRHKTRVYVGLQSEWKYSEQSNRGKCLLCFYFALQL